jgi:hypothetical protein
MPNMPRDSFEKKVLTSLQISDVTGFSADGEFLRVLHQNLSRLPAPEPTFHQIWFNGVFNGLAAAAIGIILLIGLNVLPPVLVNASVTGSGLIQEQIIQITVDQHILWQQMVTCLAKYR